MGNKTAYKKELKAMGLTINDLEQVVKSDGWDAIDHIETVLAILLQAQADREQGHPDFMIWLHIIMTCGISLPDPLPEKFILQMALLGVIKPTDTVPEI